MTDVIVYGMFQIVYLHHNQNRREMKTASEIRSLQSDTRMCVINSIMKLGFTRDQSGTLSTYVIPAIRFHDPLFIEKGMKMFKDTRHNKWADQTTLGKELRDMFNII